MIDKNETVRLHVSVRDDAITPDGIESTGDTLAPNGHDEWLCVQLQPFFLGVNVDTYWDVTIEKSVYDVYADIDDGCELFQYDEIFECFDEETRLFVKGEAWDWDTAKTYFSKWPLGKLLVRMFPTEVESASGYGNIAGYGMFVKDIAWDDVIDMRKKYVIDEVPYDAVTRKVSGLDE